MSPPGKRRQRADAQRSAARLLAAAKELFAEQGAGAPLDEIARRAHVGNATLYRHFATRYDLIVAVYADEVEELCQQGETLLAGVPAEEALFAWLQAFIAHVADKRALALALPDDGTARRSALFDEWHTAMRRTATALLGRAQRDGALRDDVTADDLLSLAASIAVTAPDPSRAERLLGLIRTGLERT